MIVDIHNLVQELVSEHQTDDPQDLAESLGLIIRFSDLGSLKGLYLLTQGFRYIIVNKNINKKMQQLVIAHEMGHDQLHRELATLGQLNAFSLYDMSSRPEMEANTFAANLLIPDEALLSLAEENEYTTSSLARMLYVPHQLLLIKMRDMNRRGYDFNLDYIPQGSFLADI